MRLLRAHRGPTAVSQVGARTTLPTLRRSVIMRLRLAGFLEAELPCDDRLDRAVVEHLLQRGDPGRSEPRSFHSVSMFSPITAFDSDICLTMLKRGMRSHRFEGGGEVAALPRHDRGGAEGNQPAAGAQQRRSCA